MAFTHLQQVLDGLYVNRPIHHLHHDPISFVHRYRTSADQEIAAVISAAFAYGNIAVILRNLNNIFQTIGPSPRNYLKHFTVAQGLSTFAHFKHRFNDGKDLCALLWAMKQIIDDYDSLHSFLIVGHDPQAKDISMTLNSFTERMLALNYPGIWEGDYPSRSFQFLFPPPASGSACKRLCMLLRWMVRCKDGIDLGIWQGINPAQLIIPVDTHISRIAVLLGLTTRKQADWAMARQITAALRELDPDDPVKYDFALAHLGISDGCNSTTRSACPTCPIADICSQGIT